MNCSYIITKIQYELGCFQALQWQLFSNNMAYGPAVRREKNVYSEGFVYLLNRKEIYTVHMYFKIEKRFDL